MRRIYGMIFAVLLAVALGVGGTLAQSQFGSVSGRVTDNSGAIVPDVKVTLSSTATSFKQTVATGAEGTYVLANVPAGDYDITVEKEGFKKTTRHVTLGVAQRGTADFSLELGRVTEVITVEAGALEINTSSGELSRALTSKELQDLPLLTRNAYGLVALTAGAGDTGTVTGDTRGLGLAVNGARTSSVNFMLDGGENNDTFVAGVGQSVPLDSVQELKVQTSNATAEFGRNPAVVNVITKSGTNKMHASVYEYYRGAALSTSTFEDNANNTPKSNFVRNQMGASAGGHILRDKLFFFGSVEGQRVRSSATAKYFVPVAAFTANASANTNAFLAAFGGLPASNCADQAITAQNIVEDIEGGGPGSYAGSPLVNSVTLAAIPAATQLFCRTTLKRPADSGGGTPQNTWLATGRVDWRVSDTTSLLGRYAFSQSNFFAGSNSFSPYPGFNTGTNTRNQNLNLTLTHSFSARTFSETRAIYNRIFNLQPLGSAPSTTPCWQYDLFNQTQSFGGNLIVFPGYVPDVCSFAGIPFGGPQNIYQVFQGFTHAKGRHTIKWGGQYLHMRDNRTFGAYENAYFDSFSMQGMLDGLVDFVFAAIDPRGKVPGQVYNTAVDGPFQFPSFTRHYHYNELAFYGEDSWKVTPRITVTAGVRWEYFGVHHSPGNEKFLDANLYLNGTGPVTPIVSSKSLVEQIRDARFSRTNQFFRPDYNNFAPRIGVAWDVFGNGRTVFRGGYSIFFDRNFGNAVFNAIQNPPNYAVISLSVSAPINANQFNTIGSGGASLTISSSARMLNNDLKTAYAEQWNGTLEHDFFGKGLIASLSYVGTNGIGLYSLNNLNQRGSCLRLVAAVPGSACNPVGGNSSRINQSGLTGMNRRGNEGLSRYNGLSAELKSRRLGGTGLNFNGNYTWSHSIDNESSFFADSSFEGVAGFGFRDPFNPALDRASSSNDIRHRFTLNSTWEVPFAKGMKGIAGEILDGWNFSGIFQAQTGGAFSVYDDSTSSQCASSGTNFCFPVATGAALPAMTATSSTTVPNSFTLYATGASGAFQTQQQFCAVNTLASPVGPLTGRGCTAVIANLRSDLVSARNLFRTPGYWNLDMAILKNFKMPWEGHRIQFRAEFFDIFNHSNLYAVPGTNFYSGGSSFVQAKRGVFPGGGFERRNIQLALRYEF